jgi:hypothetical protein
MMTTSGLRAPAAALFLAALPVLAAADEVLLKSGGRLSGRIVSRTASSIEVDVGAGKVTVPTASVLRIEEGHSNLQEYEDRASRIAANDAEGWIALGQWASGQGLGAQATAAYNRALAVAPGDPRANAGLGNVQVDGRWVSEDEGYRAKGYVRFEGEWMTPAEHDAILRERAADAAHERERQASETRAREADARAEEAEARAKQAEADAKAAEEANQGLPVWYGWGSGPVIWPSTPIVSRPIVTPRAGTR